MTFEGETKVLPIKGIERAGADNLCEDGAMNEVVGLEYKDGSYVPYAGSISDIHFKDADGNYFTPSIIRVHKTSEQNNLLVVDQPNGYVYWIVMDDNGDYKLETARYNRLDDVEGVIDIEFIGNAVCLSTSNGILYYKFKNDDYEEMLQSVAPKVILQVSRGLHNEDNIPYEGIFYYTQLPGSVIGDDTNTRDIYRSQVLKIRALAQTEGGIVGTHLITYAWRLKNGSVIRCAPIRMINMPNAKFDDTHFTVFNPTTYQTEEWEFYTPRMKDYFRFYKKNNSADFDKDTVIKIRQYNERTSPDGEHKCIYHYYSSYPESGWYSREADELTRLFLYHTGNNMYMYAATNELLLQIPQDIDAGSEIESLCIYMSQDIDQYKDLSGELNDSYYVHRSDDWWMAHPKSKEPDDLAKELSDIKYMYLIKEIHKEDFSKYRDYPVSIDLRGKLGDSMLTQELLDISSMVNYKYNNAQMSAYNSRLAIFGYDRELDNNVYPLDYEYLSGRGQIPQSTTHIDGTNIRQIQIEVDVYTKDDDGNENIYVGYRTYTHGDISAPTTFNPYLSYTDPDAYKMIIRMLIKTNSENEYYERIISLRKNTELNSAFYVREGFEPTELRQVTISVPDNLPVETDKRDSKKTKNNISFSDVLYPMYFPKESVVTIGDGSIIGIGRLTMPLSQDNFGQYPLLIFCTDGIYSLGVDSSGEKVTNNQSPFSREVCVNPNTICEIGGAVIFAADKGLMMATSNNVDFFSPLLNNEPKHLPQPNNNLGNGLYVYGSIIGTQGTVQLWSEQDSKAISRKDFINYLKNKNTFINYVSVKNKLMVYNRNEKYVYWIDIPTRNTTKLYYNLWSGNNDYPVEKYYNINSLGASKEVAFDYLSSPNSVDSMFQTRPIKIARGLKGVFSVALRGYFRNDDTYGNNKHHFAELLILGSLDGVHWSVIGIKEKSLYGGFHDFGCKTDRVSCNYIMICFSGRLQPDKENALGETDEIEGSHIDSIEVTLESRDDGKR